MIFDKEKPTRRVAGGLSVLLVAGKECRRTTP